MLYTHLQHFIGSLLNDAQVCQQGRLAQLLTTQQGTHSIGVAALMQQQQGTAEKPSAAACTSS